MQWVQNVPGMGMVSVMGTELLAWRMTKFWKWVMVMVVSHMEVLNTTE